MFKAVILDFDDTLCLTELASFELENEVLKRMDRPPMDRDVHIATWGQPLFDAISQRSPGIDASVFRSLYAVAIDEFVESGRLDAIPSRNLAALDEIIGKGMDIMILTSRVYDEVVHLLEKDHVLATRVKNFYHKDNMEHHKPDPRSFNELLAESGLSPEECVYVGDSLTDAKASNGARVSFIACLESGIRSKVEFDGYEVKAFINKFSDLPNVLFKEGK